MKRLPALFGLALFGLAACGPAQPEFPADQGFLAPPAVSAPTVAGSTAPVTSDSASAASAPAASAPADPTSAGANSPDPYVEADPAVYPTGEKDQYLTDPIPAGKPKPVEPGDANPGSTLDRNATLSIRADTILNHMDQFNSDKLSVLPPDGVIMAARTVGFAQGESVFDLLKRATRDAGVHLEFSWNPMYNSSYIEGINNIYEFDCGPLSGWMYKVNGWFPNYGSSRYAVQASDTIEWVYTCDLGRDIGGWRPGLELP
ncbi:MAG: DUF4430 domain-containing protein [Propionibacteriaceae bacterium]|nr:DUF4430 domain-containing protein [Propionibacteriaceae bacterium]